MSVVDFWEITPYELSIAVKSYEKRKEIEAKERIHHAYLISRWVWAKRIDIEKILNSVGMKREKKAMTDEQMFERVKVLNALFGGKA